MDFLTLFAPKMPNIILIIGHEKTSTGKRPKFTICYTWVKAMNVDGFIPACFCD